MPRRKIGADLKEALCKLYEAGDISADTIEKHGIMSRATFFRNLKIYKTGASLEQRHSTGRKTNADKLRQHEKQELDALQPTHLSHLELVLLLDDDDENAGHALAARNKRKGRVVTGSSKRKDTTRLSNADEHSGDVAESGSDSEGDHDDSAALASRRQALVEWTQASRLFLLASNNSAQGVAEPNSWIAQDDLDSLLKPEDSHYSHGNRGVLFIVRARREKADASAGGEIVAAVALRSLIWTPEIYQALGPSYASRSIDKIGNLVRLRVDPRWQRQGIGQWLVRVAELKASKLGFTHLYTQSAAHSAELLSFWRQAGFCEFARFDQVARLEKAAVAPPVSSKGEGTKRPARLSPVLGRTDGGVGLASSTLNPKKRRRDDRVPSSEQQQGEAQRATIPTGLPLDPTTPLDLPDALPTLSTSAASAMGSSTTAPAQQGFVSIGAASTTSAPAVASTSTAMLQHNGFPTSPAKPTPESHTVAQTADEAPPRTSELQDTSPSGRHSSS